MSDINVSPIAEGSRPDVGLAAPFSPLRDSRQPTIHSMFAPVASGWSARQGGTKRSREEVSIDDQHGKKPEGIDERGSEEPGNGNEAKAAVSSSHGQGTSGYSSSGSAGASGEGSTSKDHNASLSSSSSTKSQTELSSSRPYKQARLSLTSSIASPDTQIALTTTKPVLSFDSDGHPTFFLPTTVLARRTSTPTSISSSITFPSTSFTHLPLGQKQKLLVPHKGKFVLLDREEEIGDLKSGVKVTDVLDGLERELTCMMCSALFIDPVTISPCGHAFCGSCVVKWLKSFKLNVSVSYTNPSPILTAALAQIKARERQAAARAENYAYSARAGTGQGRHRTVSASSSSASVAAGAGAGAGGNAASQAGPSGKQELAPKWINGSKEEDDYYALDGRERGRSDNAKAGPSTGTSSCSSEQSSSSIVPLATQITHSSGHKCPFCKMQPILEASTNHALGSLVEVYKLSRPETTRSAAEVAQAKALYQKGDKLSFPTVKQTVYADPYEYASGATYRVATGRDAALQEARIREREMNQYFKPCPSCKPLTAAELAVPEADKRYVCPIPVPDPADPAHAHDRMLASGMLPECHIMCSACHGVCAEGIAISCGLCGESACGTKSVCQSVVPKLSEGHRGVQDEHEFIDYIWEYEQLSYHNYTVYPALFQHNIFELAHFLTFLQFTYKKSHGLLPKAVQDAAAVSTNPTVAATPEASGAEPTIAAADVAQVDGPAEPQAMSAAATTTPPAAPAHPQLKQWNASKIIAAIGTWLISEEGVASGGLEGMFRRADPSGIGAVPRQTPNAASGDVRVCRDCAEDIYEQGIFEWWMRTVNDPEISQHLPFAFKERARCKHGRHCPHQSNWDHCKRYSHLSVKLSPEAFEAADQPAPGQEDVVTEESIKFKEACRSARIDFGLELPGATGAGQVDPAPEDDNDSESSEDEEAHAEEEDARSETETIDDGTAPAERLTGDLIADAENRGVSVEGRATYADIASQTDYCLLDDEMKEPAEDEIIPPNGSGMDGEADHPPTYAPMEVETANGDVPAAELGSGRDSPEPLHAVPASPVVDAVAAGVAVNIGMVIDHVAPGSGEWFDFEPEAGGGHGNDDISMEGIEMEQAHDREYELALFAQTANA